MVVTPSITSANNARFSVRISSMRPGPHETNIGEDLDWAMLADAVYPVFRLRLNGGVADDPSQ